MDGITDSPYREIVDIYGHPDILFTEFVAADAIAKGATNVLYGLMRHKTKTPIIAQLFGANPENLYKAAIVALTMGFNGIDINMGCPDRKVTSRGGGAGLIKTPKLAQKCIGSVKNAVKDWKNGITLEKADINPNIINSIMSLRGSQLTRETKQSPNFKRQILPVSVKTRIGYDSVITEEWISQIIETKPDMITLHGRTLRELYYGHAHWDEIGKAAILVKQAGITFLGNGDIKSYSEAQDKIKQYSCDGVLIGRAAFGDPWIFFNKIPTLVERLSTMRHHCNLFLKFRPDLQLMPMRKHLAWYCKGFKKAAEVRNRLTKVTTLEDLEGILESIKSP